MLANQRAVAAVTDTEPIGGGGASKYFRSGRPKGGSRTRFHEGLVKIEVSDTNVQNRGKPAMTAIVRRLLAIVKKADQSVALLPIEEESDKGALESLEGVKDDGEIASYITDVTTVSVRGSKKGDGVRFTARLTQKFQQQNEKIERMEALLQALCKQQGVDSLAQTLFV